MISAKEARKRAHDQEDHLEEVRAQLEFVEDEITEAADKGLYMTYIGLDCGDDLLPEVIQEIKKNGFLIKQTDEKEEYGTRYTEYLIDWHEEEPRW